MNETRRLKDYELITATTQQWDVVLQRWIVANADYHGKQYNPNTMPLMRVVTTKSV